MDDSWVAPCFYESYLKQNSGCNSKNKGKIFLSKSTGQIRDDLTQKVLC